MTHKGNIIVPGKPSTGEVELSVLTEEMKRRKVCEGTMKKDERFVGMTLGA